MLRVYYFAGLTGFASRQRREEEAAQVRDRQRVEARLRQARIPHRFAGWTWDDLDDRFNAVAIAAARAAADPRVRLDPPGLLLLGPSGNGKSLLSALAMEAWVQASGGLWPARYWEVARELPTSTRSCGATRAAAPPGSTRCCSTSSTRSTRAAGG